MATYIIANSPFKDEPNGFFMVCLETRQIFWCQRGHSWPRTEKYVWHWIGPRAAMEKWTLSIWDGEIFKPLTTKDRKDLAAAWRWYKKYRKEMQRQEKLAAFSLS